MVKKVGKEEREEIRYIYREREKERRKRERESHFGDVNSKKTELELISKDEEKVCCYRLEKFQNIFFFAKKINC
jgi:hypothetical protein